MEPEIIPGRKSLDTGHFGPDLCLGKFFFLTYLRPLPNNGTGQTVPDLY